ncbi:glycosyl transferase, partial [Enterobacter cloacae]
MKVLIIRRDNIGDLILTTPLISTIAKDMNCKVDLLVNTYNQSI